MIPVKNNRTDKIIPAGLKTAGFFDSLAVLLDRISGEIKRRVDYTGYTK